jgi:hypothetical protein
VVSALLGDSFYAISNLSDVGSIVVGHWQEVNDGVFDVRVRLEVDVTGRG